MYEEPHWNNLYKVKQIIKCSNVQQCQNQAQEGDISDARSETSGEGFGVCFLVWWHLPIYYFGWQGMFSSALSSVLGKVYISSGSFSSRVLLSQSTIFVLSLVAKCTVIGLQQHMMKILGLLHLSVTKTSAWPCFHNLCLPCFYWLLWAVNHILFPWL